MENPPSLGDFRVHVVTFHSIGREVENAMSASKMDENEKLKQHLGFQQKNKGTHPTMSLNDSDWWFTRVHLCAAKVFRLRFFFGVWGRNTMMWSLGYFLAILGRFGIRKKPVKEFFHGRNLYSISVYLLRKPNILEPELLSL